MKATFKLRNIFFILLGAAIFSFGLVNFNMQNQLAEGGFNGITLLLFFVFNINPSISNIILNIPIFFLGWKHLSRIQFYYTILGTVAVSVFLEIFQRWQITISLQNDLMLAALFSGVFLGAGLGIIFRNNGTTGGVDIIARLVNKAAGWPMGRTMFLFDVCVLTLSLLTYLDPVRTMYTLIAVFITSRVIDFIQEGAYSARGALIISDHNMKIGEKIIDQLDRGVTILHGQGFYSQQEKKVLFCVVAKNELTELKNVVNSVDPHAFMSITDTYDVLGEGFTLDENKNPLER